jgi:hypothetical protein
MISGELVDNLYGAGVAVHFILPSKYPELKRIDIFKDLGHLNNTGAQIYSKIVSKIVVDELKQTDNNGM